MDMQWTVQWDRLLSSSSVFNLTKTNLVVQPASGTVEREVTVES